MLITQQVDRLGTLPQWISGIGTTLSTFFALYIILRDKRRNEVKQADSVGAWVNDETTILKDLGRLHQARCSVTVHNASTLPITEILAGAYLGDAASEWLVWPKNVKKASRVVMGPLVDDEGNIITVLQPGTEETGEFRYTPAHWPGYGDLAIDVSPDVLTDNTVFLVFRDNNGTTWEKDCRYGWLRRHSLRGGYVEAESQQFRPT